MNRTITILLFLVFSVMHASDLFVTHIKGNYDLDGDGFYEVVTMEGVSPEALNASAIRFYEFDDEEYQNLLWELVINPEAIPGDTSTGLFNHCIGIDVGDLDGDGTPELITVMNLKNGETDNILQPYLYIYSWDSTGFGETPVASINLASAVSFAAGNNFELMDLDGDGDQEVLVSLGAPERGIVIADMDSDYYPEILVRYRPSKLSSGTGVVYTAPIDIDIDGRHDIIVLTRQGKTLKAQVLNNDDNKLVPGFFARKDIEGLEGLLFKSMTTGDWDADGFTDLILPFKSGHVLAVTPTPVSTVIDHLPVDGGPLSDLTTADFNQDGLQDLLLVSGQADLISLYYGSEGTVSSEADYFSFENLGQSETRMYSAIPMLEIGKYTGSILTAGEESGLPAMMFLELGVPDEETLVTDKDFDEEPGMPQDIQALLPQLAFDKPLEIPEPKQYQGQPLPAGILPRHVLPVTRPFAYTVPEDEFAKFYSFRWITQPPQGMFFHYDTRSVLWTPRTDQLGAYPLAYKIEMKVGEYVDRSPVDEDQVAYQVMPELEAREERLWIYVNDPPRFLSEPMGTEFIAGEFFSYEPLIQDRNADKEIRLFLEESPEGMEIVDNVLRWQTDSSHVRVYPVRLVASDGFDRDIQEFNLYARAGVQVFSDPPDTASVNTQYTYQVEAWHQNLDYKMKYTLVDAPEGMTVSGEGIVNWVPNPAQVDTQYFSVEARHGIAVDTQKVKVFVNHPPVIIEAPPSMNLVNSGQTFEFQIVVEDPNREDVIVYNAIEMPPGMRMDPFTGKLRWEPHQDHYDFSRLVVEITDGKATRWVRVEFFVNAEIQIVSLPPMTGQVGQNYKYEIVTSDLNVGHLLPFNTIVPVLNRENIRIYSIEIADDVVRENIDNLLFDWDEKESVYISELDTKESETLSRLNLKKYVNKVFFEDNQLYVILETINGRSVKIKDVLWEFFQGNKGKPPKVTVSKQPLNRYTLTEFPDGMVLDELNGTISWTPTVEQFGIHRVSFLVSDGYTRDEQSFSIYVNHPPKIISTPPQAALVGTPFIYQIQVDDKNEDRDLKYELIKGPKDMQLTQEGRIVWTPTAAQINTNIFKIRVYDGYVEDVQENRVFVNIGPSIISTPRPIALSGHSYSYKMVTEDLNRDKVTYRPVRLPKYASFNKKAGVLSWKPKPSQRGLNDVIIVAIDEHGATTTQDFQIHVFEDPSARQFVNTSWPLMLTFVGIMFAWSVSQI